MRFSWGIAWFLLLAACTRPDDNLVETRHGTSLPSVISPELSAIDSLMWQQPDSALMRLLPYFDTCRDVSRNVSTSAEYNRHYAHLLLAELLYKNDYALTNRAELLRAVDYFDSLVDTHGADTHGMSLRRYNRRGASHASATMPQSIAFLDARAHYINGVGYYENDSVVKACGEYLKALETMEGYFEEKELSGHKAQFMALLYTRLADVFSDFYLHEQTIFYARQSLFYYLSQDVPSWYSARMIAEIGSHHEILENYDSAYYYYYQGITFLSDTNNLTYRDIAAHLAILSYKKGISPLFPTYQLRVLLTLAESEQEYASRCLAIGEIYYYEQQMDSAWYYLSIVYDKAQSVGSKKQAAEWLAEIGKTQGRKTFEFANFLVPFANLDENQSVIKTQLVSLHNSYRQTKMRSQQQKVIRKHTLYALLFIGGTMTVMLVVFSFYFKNKRSKRNLEAQMKAERHAHKMQQAALAGRLRQSNAALKAKDKSDSTATHEIRAKSLNMAGNYFEEPICRHILAVCNEKSNPIKSTVPVSSYNEIALSDAQKAEIKNAAMQHYGLLFEKLRIQYPQLKDKDYLYCYLCLLGLDNKQIAVLLQNSVSTIWDRENRLKRIFDSEDKVAVILNGFLKD